MKIEKLHQKAVLFSLFFEKGKNSIGQESLMPKEFPLEDVVDACTAKKKISPISMEAMTDGRHRLNFQESEVEFTPGEIVILKKLFDSKKTWSVDDGETVEELKNIFYPPKEQK